MKRLDQLWRRFSKDKQMENLYREFMQQYLGLGAHGKSMMFRQILSLIDIAQRNLLRIMWKTGANEEPVIYRLKTVTYGTASAPFIAIRTLKQLAMDEASRFL
ncbi:DUF1758 domain-containing protein [Trichonephila clavipes]|nr:DUF1758 domain-containing protein [Trichonephila clavipes]